MSAIIETIITCDGGGTDCEGTYANGDARHETAAQQRRNYHGDGWRFYRGKDYCCECAKNLPIRKPLGIPPR